MTKHGLKDLAALLAIVRGNPGYSRRFEEQSPMAVPQVAKALVAYLESLSFGVSLFDRYQAGYSTALSHGHKPALTSAASETYTNKGVIHLMRKARNIVHSYLKESGHADSEDRVEG